MTNPDNTQAERQHQAYNDILDSMHKRIKEATDQEIEDGYWLTYEDAGDIASAFRSERYNRQHGVGRPRGAKHEVGR